MTELRALLERLVQMLDSSGVHDRGLVREHGAWPLAFVGGSPDRAAHADNRHFRVRVQSSVIAFATDPALAE
jgi:hypothetical protein